MRFHIIGIPHTASNKDHLACAYTQKVVKLCAMLTARGHQVIHYGNEASDVAGENVPVTSAADLKFYSECAGKSELYTFDIGDPVYRKFFNVSIGEIEKRKAPNDFLLCMWGHGHKPIADAHPDMIVVEPGIGYAGGFFAPYKVFESYALLHAYLGLDGVAHANLNSHWYDVVIPNYFDLDDFEYRSGKDSYFLFLGRLGDAKGLPIAIQAATEAGVKLVVAGTGALPDNISAVPGGPIDFVGFADVDKRKRLLAGARALIAPSLFVEPFCGVTIEAMLSGTPVICSDWGAPAENVLHGVTGYRCRTFEHFVWAIKNIDAIDTDDCRRWAARNFSMDRVADMYDEFFGAIMDCRTGKGWYEPKPQRQNLDWLKRLYPAA